MNSFLILEESERLGFLEGRGDTFFQEPEKRRLQKIRGEVLTNSIAFLTLVLH